MLSVSVQFSTLASGMLGRATGAFNVTRQVGLSLSVALTALVLSMRLTKRALTLKDATTQINAIGAFQETGS